MFECDKAHTLGMLGVRGMLSQEKYYRRIEYHPGFAVSTEKKSSKIRMAGYAKVERG